MRALSAVPASEPEVALKPEHWSRLEANHRRRLQELAQRACQNIVKGLMKHQVRPSAVIPYRALDMARRTGCNYRIVSNTGYWCRIAVTVFSVSPDTSGIAS